jgi:hypothetical protein
MDAVHEIYRGIQMLLERRFARGPVLNFAKQGDVWTLT